MRSILLAVAATLALTLPAKAADVTVAVTAIVEHPALDAVRKGVQDTLAAAGYKEGAEADGEGTVLDAGIACVGVATGSAAEFLSVGVAQDRDGEGIVEHEGRCVIKLVRGSAQGYAKSSS